jgi:hypothetical protein
MFFGSHKNINEGIINLLFLSLDNLMKQVMIKPISLGILIMFFALSISAQGVLQMHAGYATGKMFNSNLNGKFGGGFEVGVGRIRKFSSNLELLTNVSFVRTKPKENACYSVKDQFAPAVKAVYDQSLTNFTYDGTLAYYLIPDKLAFGVGLCAQITLNEEVIVEENTYDYFLSNEDFTGRVPSIEDLTPKPGFNFFLIGIEGNVLFSPIERWQIYLKYNAFLQDVYGIPEGFGKVNYGAVRVGLSYKFVRSKRDIRF